MTQRQKEEKYNLSMTMYSMSEVQTNMYGMTGISNVDYVLPPSPNTSTYRLRTFRLEDACDFGRPIGGGGAEREAPGAGVVGADSVPVGMRFDRIRGVGPRFGGANESTAEPGRLGGGGGPIGEEGVIDRLDAADCGREGGGGGTAGLADSAPAFLLTHFLSSLS